jgi:AraC-like DNA-binding protein
MDKIPVRQLKETFYDDRFSVRLIEPLTEKSDLVHSLHRHDFFFMLFVKNGKGHHQIDFIDYEVGDYSVFFIKPGQVHELILKKGTSGFMLQFTTDFYNPREKKASIILRKVSSKNLCHLSDARFQRIEFLINEIFQEFTDKQERYFDAIKSYLEVLFVQLLRQSENPNQLPSESKLYAQERLEELQDLIEKNIVSTKQVSDYAAMLNMSLYQLNAVTKSLLNKTASDLINEYIVLEAKRLLIATTNQVNQVADQLGYDDPSYFIRFFKKHIGLSPETFRQNFK